MFDKVTLQDVMNSIRVDASPDYQQRIPELNDKNFREVAAGLSNPVFFNEWHHMLINRIGKTILVNRAWSNPLSPLKRGTLEFGETVQEIFRELVEAQNWESYSDETTAGKVFKTAKPDVYAVYHTINRTDMYEISENPVAIRRAFVSPKSLQEFIENIIERLYTSDMLDEYLYMKELIKVYDEQELFHYITFDVEKDTLDDLIRQARSMNIKLTFLSDNYNAMGVTTHTLRDDQVILMDADMASAIDVGVLASAFNMDKKEFLSKRIILDEFPIKDAYMAIVDENWFAIWDVNREIRSLDNPRTLEIKYFYHVHQIMSVSKLHNAILFTKKDYKKPDAIVAEDLTVQKGQYYNLEHEVQSGGSSENVVQAVRYKFAGANPNTRIEGNRLYVDVMQEDDFEIKIISLDEPRVEKVIKVTISDGTTPETPETQSVQNVVPETKSSVQNVKPETKGK